jgi:carboxylesterase type B
VAPTYRLNIFGFLASHELSQEASADGSTVGNLGFWDQRLALEWTYNNIEGFGGKKSNITVGGLSAGAYSTFHQLAYELGLPDDQAMIRRVVLFSNGAGLPPKPIQELQSHFDLLLTVLDIPKDIDAQSKIEILRVLPTKELIEATRKLPENSFRAVNDGQWVRHSLFQEIEDGRFARAMLRRGVKIMIGDLPDENNSYKMVQPPSSYESLVQRLSVEYPEAASKKLAKIYCPGGALPAGSTWTETFGHIYADMQVHVTERGLLAALARTLPLSSIYRYRINWRAECVTKFMPIGMGVAHGCDLTIWFYGNGYSLLPEEQNLMRKFLEPFAAFLNGEEREYGTGVIEEVRAILPNMSIAIMRDDDWHRCQKIWQALQLVRLARL